jgi:hypothetical protein
MNKKLLVSVLSVAAVGAGLLAVNQVSAQDAISSPQDSLIQRLVTKFGLNETEVKQVFEEEHDARHAEMAKRMEEQLTQAVNDGKLTNDQKQKILAKHEEMKANREATMESFNTMTEEERKAAMETKHEEIQTWAEANGIPLEYTMFKTKMMRGGLGRDFHMKDAQ